MASELNSLSCNTKDYTTSVDSRKSSPGRDLKAEKIAYDSWVNSLPPVDWDKINSIPPGSNADFHFLPHWLEGDLKPLDDPQSKIDDFPKDNFNFATDITLNKYDWVIYGKGEKPVYCQRPYVNGLASDGSGAKVIYTTCDTMGCPSCGSLWALRQVFNMSVHLEAYARYSGSRPAHGEASVKYDRGFTLDDIRKLRRNTNNRLKKQGVTAGYNMFHPFRGSPDVKKAFRAITKVDDSARLWKFIRDDHKQGNIEKVNEVLGTDFTDWYQLVVFAPHLHFFCFPGNQKFTGDEDLVIKKNSFKDGDKKVWTLRTSTDVVKTVSYLLSHAGQLSQGKGTRFKPLSPFGEMHKKSPEKLVSASVLQEIKLEILTIMNNGRKKPLVLDGDTVSYSVPELNEENTFIPLSDFRLVSLEANENVRQFESIVLENHPENLDYIRYLIDLYNYLHECSDVPQKYKRLFVEPFGDDESPPFVLLLNKNSLVRKMFEHGLMPPPESFKMYLNGHAGVT